MGSILAKKKKTGNIGYHQWIKAQNDKIQSNGIVSP